MSNLDVVGFCWTKLGQGVPIWIFQAVKSSFHQVGDPETRHGKIMICSWLQLPLDKLPKGRPYVKVAPKHMGRKELKETIIMIVQKTRKHSRNS